MKRIITYLRGTSDYGITYTGNAESILTAWTDSDFAGDVITSKVGIPNLRCYCPSMLYVIPNLRINKTLRMLVAF